MAETYYLSGDGLYTQDAAGRTALVAAGSIISGVPGAYVVTSAARGQAVDTPVGFAFPASWTPASVASPMNNGRSRARLWATEQNSYNVLRQQWPDAAIMVQPGKEGNVVRQP